MSCNRPSRVLVKASTPSCSTTPRCCTKSGTFVQYQGDKCCDPTDWIEYTPIISTLSNPQPVLPTVSTLRGRYKIIDGNTLIVKFHYSQSDETGSSPGSGNYNISLPPGLLAFMENDISEVIVGAARAIVDDVLFSGYITTISNTLMNISFGNDTAPVNAWSSTNTSLDSDSVFQIQAVATIELTDKILISS